jgi:hypothetical protein
MNFNIFKPKQKTPHDLAKHLKDYIHKLDGPDKRKVMDKQALKRRGWWGWSWARLDGGIKVGWALMWMHA